MKTSRLFLSLLTATFAASAPASAAPKEYRFETYDVPAEAGAETNANGLNNPGTIVGSFLSGEGNRDGFVAGKRNFTEVVVPDAAASNRGTLVGIGENGRAVGTFADVGGNTHVFLRSKKGDITIQEDPEEAVSTFAGGINNPGTIVGWFEDGEGVLHGFTLRRGTYEVYDFPDAVDTQLTGLNDNGQTVGFWTDAEGDFHGFLLRNGNTTPIEFPEATSTQPLAINDRGQIVGTYLDPEGNNHGFLYDRGEYRTLDYPGAVDTVLSGIDDSGDIVGTYDAVHGLTATAKRGRWR